MGSEFAEPQKRPETKQQQPQHAPKQQSDAKSLKPNGLASVPTREHSEGTPSWFTQPQQDPNDGHKKLSWWTPEMAKTAVEPTRSAYRGGKKRVDTMTPQQREQCRETLANDPELSWLLDKNGRRPTPFEVLQVKRMQRSEEPSPIAVELEPTQVASTTLTPGMSVPTTQALPESLVPAAKTGGETPLVPH